jgi:hypothetical protein
MNAAALIPLVRCGYASFVIEEPSFMVAMLVELDFDCCKCCYSVRVKLKCEGKGLAGGGNTVLAVNIPCPTCGSVNELLFEPCGTVREVRPCRPTCGIPEPCWN